MRPAFRVLVTLLLFGVVVVMGIHYDATSGQHWPYSSNEELASDYDAHVGESALLFGTVEEVDAREGTAKIRVTYAGGGFEMHFRNVEAAVQPGGYVQVYGKLAPDRTISAERVVVVNRSRSSELYKYAASALGAVLVLVAFFRRWTVNPRQLTLEAR